MFSCATTTEKFNNSDAIFGQRLSNHHLLNRATSYLWRSGWALSNSHPFPVWTTSGLIFANPSILRSRHWKGINYATFVLQGKCPWNTVRGPEKAREPTAQTTMQVGPQAKREAWKVDENNLDCWVMEDRLIRPSGSFWVPVPPAIGLSWCLAFLQHWLEATFAYVFCANTGVCFQVAVSVGLLVTCVPYSWKLVGSICLANEST